MKRQLALAAGISLPILLTALSNPSFSQSSENPNHQGCAGNVCRYRSSNSVFQINTFGEQSPLTEQSTMPLSPENFPNLAPPQPSQPHQEPSTKQVPTYRGPALDTPSILPSPQPSPQPSPDYNIQVPSQQTMSSQQSLTPEQVGAYTYSVIANLKFPAFEWSRIETVRQKRFKWDLLGVFGKKEVAVHTHSTRFQQDGGMGLIDTILELQNFACHTGSQYNSDNQVNSSNFERHCGALAIPPEYVHMVEGQAAYTQTPTDLDKMVHIGSKGLEVIPYTSANGNHAYLGNAEIMRNHKTSGSNCAGGHCK